MPDDDVWYTVGDLAERWRTSERHVYQLVAKHGLPHVKIGAKLRFKQADLKKWEASRRGK